MFRFRYRCIGSGRVFDTGCGVCAIVKKQWKRPSTVEATVIKKGLPKKKDSKRGAKERKKLRSFRLRCIVCAFAKEGLAKEQVQVRFMMFHAG